MAKKHEETRSDAPKIDENKFPRPIHVLREERIKRHKEQAEKWKGKRRGEFEICPCANFLHLVGSPGIKLVNYDVSDEEWERQTGFKN